MTLAVINKFACQNYRDQGLIEYLEKLNTKICLISKNKYRNQNYMTIVKYCIKCQK